MFLLFPFLDSFFGGVYVVQRGADPSLALFGSPYQLSNRSFRLEVSRLRCVVSRTFLPILKKFLRQKTQWLPTNVAAEYAAGSLHAAVLPALSGPALEIPASLVVDRPLAAPGELTMALVERGGRWVHPATVRVPCTRRSSCACAAPGFRNYGNTARHHALALEQRYPSSPTNGSAFRTPFEVPWARLAAGAQPPPANRCLLLMRAHGTLLAPLTQGVCPLGQHYMTFRRWRVQGR